MSKVVIVTSKEHRKDKEVIFSTGTKLFFNSNLEAEIDEKDFLEVQKVDSSLSLKDKKDKKVEEKKVDEKIVKEDEKEKTDEQLKEELRETLFSKTIAELKLLLTEDSTTYLEAEYVNLKLKNDIVQYILSKV